MSESLTGLLGWGEHVGFCDRERREAAPLDGCLATSILVALALNLVFGWWWADPAAALLIGAVADREARESWHDEPAATESSSA